VKHTFQSGKPSPESSSPAAAHVFSRRRKDYCFIARKRSCFDLTGKKYQLQNLPQRFEEVHAR
jgi:hypothetical protein